MPDAGPSGLPPTLLFGLLASLRQVAARCDSFTCPVGYKCCFDNCCLMHESIGSLKLFITVILVTVLLLCLCGVIKRFCCKCEEPEPEPESEPELEPDFTMDYSTAPHTTHPRPPPEIRASIPEHPPPYHEVILKPDQDLYREPPPPYSLRPEGYWGTSRGIDNPAF